MWRTDEQTSSAQEWKKTVSEEFYYSWVYVYWHKCYLGKVWNKQLRDIFL